MMHKKYVVDLTEEERDAVQGLMRTGQHSARKICWAHALLKADAGWTDVKISEALDMSVATVERIRRRFVEEGIDVALGGRRCQPRPYARKLDGKGEAQLIALACSRAPEGHARWTLRLLAERMVELCYVESVSHETVRKVLKKRVKTMAC